MALIGEVALRQHAAVGGEVLREQIDNLTEIIENSAEISIRILPITSGAPSCGPATILRFADASSLGAVYLPGLSGVVCLAGQQDVTSYTRVFEHLKAFALSTTDTARLLRGLAGS